MVKYQVQGHLHGTLQKINPLQTCRTLEFVDQSAAIFQKSNLDHANHAWQDSVNSKDTKSLSTLKFTLDLIVLYSKSSSFIFRVQQLRLR